MFDRGVLNPAAVIARCVDKGCGKAADHLPAARILVVDIPNTTRNFGRTTDIGGQVSEIGILDGIAIRNDADGPRRDLRIGHNTRRYRTARRVSYQAYI